MRLVTWNLHFALGTDYRFAPGRILDALDGFGADVACLQESELRIGRRSALPLDGLAARGWTRVGAVAPRSLGYRGNAILLRDGWSASDAAHVPLRGWDPRGALIARLAGPRGAVTLACVHLGLQRRHRLAQLRRVLAALAERPGPHVIAGDTNEWRRRALPLPDGWTDTAPGKSFSSRMRAFPLDRVLAGPGLAVSDARVETEGFDRRASDHLPVTATLGLSGSSP